MACSIAGCEGESKKRGLCLAHYSLFYRTGELERYASEPGRGSYVRREAGQSCSGVAECGKQHCARGFCSPCYQHKKAHGLLGSKPVVNIGALCSVDGCEDDARTRGYCQKHYEKWLKYGDPLAYAPRRTGGACRIEGCDGTAVARGLCRACYSFGRTHGFGASRVEAKAKRDGEIIDDQGYVMVLAPSHPNARKSKRVPKHRMVMSEFLGRALRANENVHHKNGVKTDNRMENLELWVTSQPKGQRPQDLVEHAKKILRTYARDSEKLKQLDYR